MNEREKKLLLDLDTVDGYWDDYDCAAMPYILEYANEIKKACADRLLDFLGIKDDTYIVDSCKPIYGKDIRAVIEK
jgi:hypothetical protein